MEDTINELTEEDLDEAIIRIENPTIPVKKSSTREWIARQIQELSLRLLSNPEIISFEIRGNILTKSCTIMTQLSKDINNDS